MKIAALILGIIGGIFGLLGAIFALGIGGVGSAFGAEGAKTVAQLGITAIFFSILGIIGGSLSLSRPKVAGILMIVSAVVGSISISMGYIIAGPLLLVGGIFALMAKKKNPASVSNK